MKKGFFWYAVIILLLWVISLSFTQKGYYIFDADTCFWVLSMFWGLVGTWSYVWFLKYNEKLLIEHYSRLFLPIIEGNLFEGDKGVVLRYEAHKKLLAQSKNEVLKESDVHMIFFRDKENFHETWEEYQLRFIEERKAIEKHFVKRIGNRDEKWTQQYLYQQMVL
jgi:hypothetical protein